MTYHGGQNISQPSSSSSSSSTTTNTISNTNSVSDTNSVSSTPVATNVSNNAGSYKLEPSDSSSEVKEFFDKYFTDPISYSATQVDSVVGFFLKRGFEESSATGVATVLLQQAKIDNVNVYTLLDTLKGLEDVQISGLVGEIVNYNRSKVSVIGFKTDNTITRQESRNIVV